MRVQTTSGPGPRQEPEGRKGSLQAGQSGRLVNRGASCARQDSGGSSLVTGEAPASRPSGQRGEGQKFLSGAQNYLRTAEAHLGVPRPKSRGAPPRTPTVMSK